MSLLKITTLPKKYPTIWNKLPDYIFVRFETRTRWTIPGIDQENVFPVSIQSAQWFLDAGRANPQLKVTRYQFPIAPDFADTFYGAQGSTIEPGVIVDMVGADPIAAYIGMTRSRTRQKILIYRPFRWHLFKLACRSDGNFCLTCGSRSRWTGMRCARSTWTKGLVKSVGR